MRVPRHMEVSSTMGERIDEAKGNLKQGMGKVTGDEELEAEGGAERVLGGDKTRPVVVYCQDVE